MKLGMIGLGRMGMNMARRLIQKKHEVVAYNRTIAKTLELADEGGRAAATVSELVSALPSPRVVWIMLPAGEVVDRQIDELAQLLSPGDIIIDGGNSRYHDDLRRAEELSGKGIRYLDAGVSGGIWGLAEGYCLMVGGDEKAFHTVEPILKSLAPENGYLHCGPVGSGHYVKMIHNGIEYGMMQAYGEGFALLNASRFGPGLDLEKIAALWNRGSVVRSWLLELMERAFAEDPSLEKIRGYVDDSGEGRWTVNEAVDLGVAAPVITASLFKRFQSRDPDEFSDRVLAALRQQFGGHAVKKVDNG